MFLLSCSGKRLLSSPSGKRTSSWTSQAAKPSASGLLKYVYHSAKVVDGADVCKKQQGESQARR